MSKFKKNLVVAIIFFVLFAIFTVVIKNVDVQEYNVVSFENGAVTGDVSNIGLATINKGVESSLGINHTWYNVSKYLGYIAFLPIVLYALVGLVQLIKNKSLKKVDGTIISLGILYVVVGIWYVLFEVLKINYRPVLMSVEEGIEASYPSSHTMLAICVCTSAAIANLSLINKKQVRMLINTILFALMFAIVLARTLSGAHWITDIFGSILLSLANIQLFMSVKGKLTEDKSKEDKSKEN